MMRSYVVEGNTWEEYEVWPSCQLSIGKAYDVTGQNFIRKNPVKLHSYRPFREQLRRLDEYGSLGAASR